MKTGFCVNGRRIRKSNDGYRQNLRGCTLIDRQYITMENPNFCRESIGKAVEMNSGVNRTKPAVSVAKRVPAEVPHYREFRSATMLRRRISLHIPGAKPVAQAKLAIICECLFLSFTQILVRQSNSTTKYRPTPIRI